MKNLHTTGIVLILHILLSLLSAVFFTTLQAQTGLSVSPPRSYFTLNEGQTEEKALIVSNPSKNSTLELSVSFGDWKYDSLGNNVMAPAGTLPNSCADWLNALPQSFFSIAPQTSYELNIQMKVPHSLPDTVPVHTAMVYITQINPIDGVDEQGANIKIALQSGVKVYHRKSISRTADLDVTGFGMDKKAKDRLLIEFTNVGNVWTDGTLSCEVLNQSTGKKQKLQDIVFYTMPGDTRIASIELPEDFEEGKYIATAFLHYEHSAALKMAELTFKYEKLQVK